MAEMQASNPTMTIDVKAPAQPVPTALNDLAQSIDRLSAKVDGLVESVNPILRPANPQEVGRDAIKGAPGESQITGLVYDLMHRVDYIADRVDETRSRVEV